MAIGKVKLAVISSALAGFAAGGVLMAAMPAFASTPSTTAHATQAQNWNGVGMHRRGPGLQLMQKDMAQLASELHITKAQLNTDLKAGKSLDDIAAASGVSQATLASDLKTMIQTDLQARVAAGKMTATQETKVMANMDAHLTNFMANTHLRQRPPEFGAGKHVLGVVATELKLTKQQLFAKLHSGQSINQIAVAQGVSPATLQKDLTQKLDAQLNSHIASLMAKTDWSMHQGRSTSPSKIG